MLKTGRKFSVPAMRTGKSLYRKTVLDNGIRVVTESIPYVRSASLGVWANVGSRDENEKQNGITHFLEHMVFKGTKSRSVRDIARSLESLGGYLNASTNKEQTCYYARVLDMHVEQGVDVLSDLVQNATFPKTEMEREKQVVIEELKNSEDDPEDCIHDFFEKALFPKHALGFPIIGTEANLRRFRREDLQTYVASHYHPSRIVVAAAGNLEHEEFVRFVEKRFRRLPARAANGRRSVGPSTIEHSTYAEYPRPIKQAHVCLGTVAYSLKHRHRYALSVMNALLGEGMSSRLFQNIREKYGFAYSVYSYVNMMSDTGIFGVYIGTDEKNIGNSIGLIHKELERLKTKPVTRVELERTKAQIRGVLMFGLENISGRMMRLGSSELYFEKFTPLEDILEKIDAVTSETIQCVANNLLRDEKFSTVVIRPS